MVECWMYATLKFMWKSSTKSRKPQRITLFHHTIELTQLFDCVMGFSVKPQEFSHQHRNHPTQPEMLEDNSAFSMLILYTSNL